MANALYNFIFKRSSTFTIAIIASSFFFERAFDLISNEMFEQINKGKLWKDIKDQYENK
ncbi:cytochrome b-c1 complex subunit 9 [Apis cerana]|uniref:Complex III subunit 9 n=3 Tax=Apis TaxID=7459 RepID=A0A7M7LT84_APIME|nr:cytochrome b-c1 complex subunit 9 [Apis mellifera]XP_006570675.1 cytochrome b-c1 complex subunit 9 [Apis mellifera]XP_061931124.1 cytochrome b-c1 complex subunit 9 [Apis cerana]PBC33456.1 Cytochrome b-c1 complex subunit [Apis cerana cerana]|eukprot:XP_003251593.1 cytochrome b-c1 complex subunit 9 [Apis mellifera]